MWKMEDFATLLLPFCHPFGSRLVHVWLNFGTQKGVPYSRTERSKQSSNLNNYESKIKI